MALARRPRHEPELAPGPRQFRSPGLELVIRRLRDGDKPQVLDLGAPRRTKIEFLTRTPCKLWVEDLGRCLVGTHPPPAAGDAPPDWDAHVRARLSFDPRTRLDIVLAWDVLSYLEPAAIRPLMSAVGDACHEQSLLFITGSTQGGIGERPERLGISPDGELVRDVPDAGIRPNPRYTPLALERMMPGFRLLHSFMLGEGMQDYLFGYRSG